MDYRSNLTITLIIIFLIFGYFSAKCDTAFIQRDAIIRAIAIAEKNNEIKIYSVEMEPFEITVFGRPFDWSYKNIVNKEDLKKIEKYIYIKYK